MFEKSSLIQNREKRWKIPYILCLIPALLSVSACSPQKNERNNYQPPHIATLTPIPSDFQGIIRLSPCAPLSTQIDCLRWRNPNQLRTYEGYQIPQGTEVYLLNNFLLLNGQEYRQIAILTDQGTEIFNVLKNTVPDQIIDPNPTPLPPPNI